MSFRPIETDDIKYAGAAWKKGALKGLDPALDQDMTPEEFRRVFTELVLQNGAAWTIEAKTPRGKMPVGFVFGSLAGGVISVRRAVALPWCSSRMRLQGFLTWVNGIRREFMVLITPPLPEKRFYEQICRYGVMRRVGTLFDMGSEPLALFQSRR